MIPAEVASGAGRYPADPLVWTVLSLLMGVAAAVAGVCSWRTARALRHRTSVLTGAPGQAALGVQARARRTATRKGRAFAGRLPVRRAVVPEVAGALGGFVLGAVLVGGTARWPAGTVAALVGWQWQRRRARRAAHRGTERGPEAVERHLPLVAELLAACLTAGSGPAQAAEAVGRSAGGPLGARLVRAAAELRLGGEPAEVWGSFAALPGCEGLARCMERAGTAGVPPVQAVARLAAECRERRSRAAAARARRAAVQVTGPLGLCFLPAFLAVGVAPVVLGLARSLL